MAENVDDEPLCTYALITRCNKEGLNGTALRNCYQCGSEGLHHHMCAVSEPKLEKASAVPHTSETKCAVCADVLTLDQVILGDSDKAAAHYADEQKSNTDMPAVSNEMLGDGSISKSDDDVAGECDKIVAEAAASADAVPLSEDASASIELPSQTAANDSAAASTGATEGVGVGFTPPLEPPLPAVGSAPTEADNATAAQAKAEGADAKTSEASTVRAGIDFTDSNNGGADELESHDSLAGAAPATAEKLYVGRRVRELNSTESCFRNGLVFSDVGTAISVAFDDHTYSLFEKDSFHRHLGFLPAFLDKSSQAVRSVLLGQKGSLTIASGFLLSSSVQESAATNGWEVFENYAPAPFDSEPGRYAEPPLPFGLGYGTAVKVHPPFVSFSGAKVGVDPNQPFTAMVVCPLLGGSWNSTRKHLDKRRWVLLEHEEHFYLCPLNTKRLKPGSVVDLPERGATMEACKGFAHQLVQDRTPAGVNSLYQWANKSHELYSEGAAAGAHATNVDSAAGGRPGLRVRQPNGREAPGDADSTGPVALTTPAPARRRGAKYDPYKDPNLVLPMDLKSWGPSKLKKLMLQVILRALEAHGVLCPAEGPKQKDHAIKALLRVTKKRRQPDSGSEGDGAGTRDDMDDSASVESGMPPGQRRAQGGGRGRFGRAAGGRAMSFADDTFQLSSGGEETLEERRRGERDGSEGIAMRAAERAVKERLDAAERALKEREDAAQRMLDQAKQLELKFLAQQQRLDVDERQRQRAAVADEESRRAQDSHPDLVDHIFNDTSAFTMSAVDEDAVHVGGGRGGGSVESSNRHRLARDARGLGFLHGDLPRDARGLGGHHHALPLDVRGLNGQHGELPRDERGLGGHHHELPGYARGLGRHHGDARSLGSHGGHHAELSKNTHGLGSLYGELPRDARGLGGLHGELPRDARGLGGHHHNELPGYARGLGRHHGDARSLGSHGGHHAELSRNAHGLGSLYGELPRDARGLGGLHGELPRDACGFGGHHHNELPREARGLHGGHHHELPRDVGGHDGGYHGELPPDARGLGRRHDVLPRHALDRGADPRYEEQTLLHPAKRSRPHSVTPATAVARHYPAHVQYIPSLSVGAAAGEAPRVSLRPPTPQRVREGMEIAALRARADARRREDEERFAALTYKASQYEYY